MTKKINGWLRARHMRDLFSVEIGERDGLTARESRAARPLVRDENRLTSTH